MGRQRQQREAAEASEERLQTAGKVIIDRLESRPPKHERVDVAAVAMGNGNKRFWADDVQALEPGACRAKGG